jgi:hypothetical protein
MRDDKTGALRPGEDEEKLPLADEEMDGVAGGLPAGTLWPDGRTDGETRYQ